MSQISEKMPLVSSSVLDLMMNKKATNFAPFSLSGVKTIFNTLFILFYTYQIFSHPLGNQWQTFLNTLNLGNNLIQLIEVKQKTDKKVNR